MLQEKLEHNWEASQGFHHEKWDKFQSMCTWFRLIHQAKERFFKNGREQLHQNWLEWENNGVEQLSNKTALTTHHTFIGLATEYEEVSNRLWADGVHHIIFTICSSIPDMKLFSGTKDVPNFRTSAAKAFQ